MSATTHKKIIEARRLHACSAAMGYEDDSLPDVKITWRKIGKVKQTAYFGMYKAETIYHKNFNWGRGEGHCQVLTIYRGEEIIALPDGMRLNTGMACAKRGFLAVIGGLL